MTEENLVFYEYDSLAEDPFFMNDTEREFFVQAIFVLYPCGMWSYESYNREPYLRGVSIGIQRYKPVFVGWRGAKQLRPLSETLKEHNGFVILLSEAIGLIEGKDVPPWRKEKDFIINKKSGVVIAKDSLRLLQEIPEIRSALVRAVCASGAAGIKS